MIGKLFVRVLLPSDSSVSGRSVTRREHLGRSLSLFGLIYGPVKEEEIVFACALRGLAATFLRFAPIVCPRGMSVANFRPHLKACSGEKTICAPFFFLSSFFFFFFLLLSSQRVFDRQVRVHDEIASLKNVISCVIPREYLIRLKILRLH